MEATTRCAAVLLLLLLTQGKSSAPALVRDIIKITGRSIRNILQVKSHCGMKNAWHECLCKSGIVMLVVQIVANTTQVVVSCYLHFFIFGTWSFFWVNGQLIRTDW